MWSVAGAEMGNSKTSTKQVVDKRVTIAQAARDIVIAAMNKGQLIPVVLGAGIIIILWRMPSDDVTKLANRLLDMLSNHAIVGYALWLVTIMVWYVHATHVRNVHNVESGRIGKEKSRLQEQLSDRALPSSRGPK
jgi:hypothetical protein